ncbi:G-protein coupled receptor GRL101, partial [Stylophora pistillata]
MESTERTDGTDGTDRTDHMDRTVLTDMAIVNALDDPLIKGHVIGDVWITEIRSTMASSGNKPGRVTRDVTSVSYDLSYNQLEQLPPRAFYEIIWLYELFYLTPPSSYDAQRKTISDFTWVERSTAMFTKTDETDIFLNNNKLRNLSSDQLPKYTIENVSRIENLTLDFNKLETLPSDIFQRFKLYDLRLSGNQLEKLPRDIFHKLPALEKLDLSYNQLLSLPRGILRNNVKLEELAVYENNIDYLPSGVFKGMKNMMSMSFYFNKIRTVTKEQFKDIAPTIRFLYFHYNQMRKLPEGFFSNMKNLITVTVDTNLMCCHLTKEDADCDYAYVDMSSFSSCENMFRDRAPRICLWVVGIMSLLGAVFVIVWRLVFKEAKKKNKIQSIMLIHLAGSDGLMSVYLIIIGVMDAIWAGQYFLHDGNWRSSWLCQITGAIAVLSSEVSVMTICLLSADRVKNILFPYRGKSLTIKVTHVLCFLIWIIGGLIAFIPMVGIDYFGSRQKAHHFYGRSVVCLPLQLSADKPSGWEYSVAMFVGLNFTLVFFVIVAYSMIVYTSCTSNRRLAQQGTARERKIKAKQRAADLRREASLAKRVFFIVLTDCVCWLPIVVIGLRSLLEKSFLTPGGLAVWIAVFVLPVNSAINPILYTLSTKQVRCILSPKLQQFLGYLMEKCGRNQNNEGSVELIAQLQQMQLDASKVIDKTDLKAELKKIATDKGFRIVDNEGSGHCMFYALSDQLEIAMRIKIKHDELRQILVQYLRKNPKLPNGTDLFHFVHGHQSWADYLTYMEQDGAWG